MADIGGSVEDYIVKKLKLNELLKKDQPAAVLNFFKSIISGEVKTTPPEFKGLLQIMINKQADDDKAQMTSYILNNDDPIRDFFVRNFQRFNYYEFKHQLMTLKGELPSQEFLPPLYDKRNFEKMEPLDITPYAEMLESNPVSLERKKRETKKVSPEVIAREKQQNEESFDEKILAFKNQLKNDLNKGRISKESLEKKISEVEEMCIPALQMRYNTKAVENLNNILLGNSEIAAASPVKYLMN